jgi:F0F1-type ATP synthase membrane subunit b/b'
MRTIDAVQAINDVLMLNTAIAPLMPLVMAALNSKAEEITQEQLDAAGFEANQYIALAKVAQQRAKQREAAAAAAAAASKEAAK